MKLYDITDKELKRSLGCLVYFEQTGDFVVELMDDLDEWTAPLLFTSYIKKGIWTVPRKSSASWVSERIIPSGRQNIGNILLNHGLKEYDEMKFLEISRGKSSQDAIQIKKIDEIPLYVQARQKKNIKECTVCRDASLICFFKDDLVRKIKLKELGEKLPEYYLNNEKLIKSCRVAAGGYSISFDDNLDIAAAELRNLGDELPLSINDFIDFSKNTFVDTAKACDILGCTRQNINYKINHNQLKPIKLGEERDYFLKSSLYNKD